MVSAPRDTGLVNFENPLTAIKSRLLLPWRLFCVRIPLSRARESLLEFELPRSCAQGLLLSTLLDLEEELLIFRDLLRIAGLKVNSLLCY